MSVSGDTASVLYNTSAAALFVRVPMSWQVQRVYRPAGQTLNSVSVFGASVVLGIQAVTGIDVVGMVGYSGACVGVRNSPSNDAPLDSSLCAARVVSPVSPPGQG